MNEMSTPSGNGKRPGDNKSALSEVWGIVKSTASTSFETNRALVHTAISALQPAASTVHSAAKKAAGQTTDYLASLPSREGGKTDLWKSMESGILDSKEMSEFYDTKRKSSAGQKSGGDDNTKAGK